MSEYICDGCGSDIDPHEGCRNMNCDYYGCTVVMQFERADEEE